jgi:ribosomal protein S18 acetylase RimI-like enzyme
MDPEHAALARAAAASPVKATRADIPRLNTLLSDAFRDDPCLQWTFRAAPGYQKSLGLYFDFALANQCAQHDAMFMSADGNAAAVWLPPAGLAALSLPPVRMLRMLPRLIAMTGFSRMTRAMATGEAMEKHHPPEPPHWYLFFIGVPSHARGLGLGSAILEATLKRVDDDGMPAYLDNSNPKNTRLYERHGFRVISEYHARKDAPPFWGMWRDARK